MNIIAIFHSYQFTHFADGETEKTKSPNSLFTAQKIKTLILGVSNSRPENKIFPTSKYETIKLKSNKEIEWWSIKKENSKGTIILFHGFGGDKSSMLDKAEIFNQLVYRAFLVDFMGSGGSEANQITFGFFRSRTS